MADRTGCAVIGLAHFNKSASPDPLNLITGSRAFSAVARAVLAVACDDDSGDGSCVISQAKNNLGRLDLPSLGYRIESHTIETDDSPAEVTLKRARKRAGIATTRQRFGQGSVWTLDL